MAQPLRFATRRAKTASERAGGKRWIAQAEFPGGRTIEFARTRDRAQAVDTLQTQVDIAAQAAGTAQATPDQPYNPRNKFESEPNVTLE